MINDHFTVSEKMKKLLEGETKGFWFFVFLFLFLKAMQILGADN